MTSSHNLNAALLALTASAMLSFIDNFVAPVSEEAGLWQFQVVRTVFAVFMLIVWARLSGTAWKPRDLPRIIVRSLTVSSGLLIYFATLGFLPVAQSAAGLFSAPLWVLVFSKVLFGSRITWPIMLAMACGFCGVLMLLQPNFSDYTGGSLFPLAAGAFYGLGMLLTRHWSSEETAVCLALSIFVTMGLVSAIALLFFSLWPVAPENSAFVTRGWEPMTSRFFWLTLFQAVGAVIAVSLISQAYRIGTPAFVAVFEYSFLLFAVLWSYLLWGHVTNPLANAGILVIIASGTLMSLIGRRSRV